MSDFDSPWKEVLDRLFELFLAFFFPDAYAEIDWSRGYEVLDKELQKIVRQSEQGRRVVDKLVKVWLKSGDEQWLLIHIEIQTSKEGDFPLRMHVYNYRIFDRYNREVISLAILADDDPEWRPARFGYGRWGFRTETTFPAVKLLDFVSQQPALEADPNPFALVVLSHLKTLETRRAPAERRAWKVRLIKGLYERGLKAEDVRQLFRFIDWIMDLPKSLDDLFWEEITRYEEEKSMPFVTTPERLAREKCFLKGIEVGLKVKFGTKGLELLPEIREQDHNMLEAILQAIETARTPEELRRVWTSEAPPTPSATPEEDEPESYLTGPERTALKKGLLQGIEACLKLKFGMEGLKLLPEIRALSDPEVLREILEAIDTATSPNELRRIWAP